MKAKKVLALFVAAVMTMSLAACGNDEAGSGDVQQSSPEQTTESTQESSTEVAPSSEEPGDTAPVEAGPASIDFEDGLFGFIGDNTSVVGGIANAASYNVVDYSGSKALEVVPNGKGVGVGFQIDALLGDKASQVKSVELSIGAKSSDGKFYACSGKLYGLYAGEKDYDPWSVYLETANPKTATYEVPEGKTFGEGDNFVVSLETDNANSEGAGWQTLYIDNVTFKDASGNVIEADSSAEYVAVASGADPNLLVLKDVVDLEGFACSAGGWSQAGIELTDEQKALFVPGTVIEIEYKSDAPVWLIAKAADENPNPLGNWLRAVNQDTFIVDGYVASDNSKVQYTYEQLAAYWGDDFMDYTIAFDAESSADWEVYSVKIGTDSGLVTLGSAVELEGFACNAGGWSQAGIELTDEQKALFVPGCIVEIEYSSDAPVWLIAKANDDNPNPLGNWLRAVNQEGDNAFVVDGAVADGKVQYTYEQLAAYWGDDFVDYLAAIDAESSADWEVYSVKVGSKAWKPAHNVVALEGFACSAAGWAQAGIELTEEQVALFKPGCVVNVEYASDSPVWLIAKANDDNPNPLGNWLRGVEQEGFIVDGAVLDGKVQYTYETLVGFWGDDFTKYLTAIDAESSADWEVYSVSIGQTE